MRLAKVLTGAVAAGLLGVWLLKPPLPGGIENRVESAFPGLTAGDVTDGSAFRRTDAALRDRLALRQYVVTAIGDAAKNKLNVSLSPQVVLGDGGTPFTAEDFTLPCDSGFAPADTTRGLDELTALARRHGTSLLVTVAPDKSAVLTDQLGRFGSALMSCSDTVRRKTETAWPQNAAGPVLTMWNPMQRVEQTDPGQVYQHGDTHWTTRGALVFSHEVISRLIAQGEAPEALAGEPVATRGPDQMDDADLYRMMGTPRQEQVPMWGVTRPEVTVTSKRLESPSGRGIPVYHTVPKDGAPLITGKTLVIHDSFFSRAESQLAPFFSDLEVMHWADFLAYVQRGEMPHVDRIIVETVQRGWPQRAGWLADGQPVHEALADALAGRPAVPHGDQLRFGLEPGETGTSVEATTPP